MNARYCEYAKIYVKKYQVYYTYYVNSRLVTHILSVVSLML